MYIRPGSSIGLFSACHFTVFILKWHMTTYKALPSCPNKHLIDTTILFYHLEDWLPSLHLSADGHQVNLVYLQGQSLHSGKQFLRKFTSEVGSLRTKKNTLEYYSKLSCSPYTRPHNAQHTIKGIVWFTEDSTKLPACVITI